MINRIDAVDDFYRDPDALVNAALGSIRAGGSIGNYAGKVTSYSFLS